MPPTSNQPIPARRRVRSETPRRCQVVVRFTDDELASVRAAANAAGLAVGAWLGDLATRALTHDGAAAGLPELLRLHADVTTLTNTPALSGEARRLLARIDGLIDAWVAGRSG